MRVELVIRRNRKSRLMKSLILRKKVKETKKEAVKAIQSSRSSSMATLLWAKVKKNQVIHA